MCLLVSNSMFSYVEKNTEMQMMHNLCACQCAPLHMNAATGRGAFTQNR
jgi:hypothetical protein